jgi:2-keto-4-pentenoate hydratase/2-oxohepta-3-ene-1,7-dioic acid hydratase in catechol pathway
MVRLCQFSVAGVPSLGCQLPDGSFVDLTAALAASPDPLHSTGVSGGPSMCAFISHGDAALDFARAAVASGAHRVAAASAKLLAPITDPSKVICVGMNYKEHCTEQDYPIPTEPVIFSKFPSCICGEGDDIVLRPETSQLDWEVELCVVIGKGGTRIAKADAYDHVLGYTVAHDVSARDLQLNGNGGQWLVGKAFDTFAPIGPCIVTSDDIGNVDNLRVQTTVNGATVQDSNTSEFVFTVDVLVEHISKFMTLCPGDLIFTGTPSGVGCFRKPPVWLNHGDVAVCTIENIGSVTNTVVAETPAEGKL